MNNTKETKNIALVHIGRREKSGLQIYEKLSEYKFKIKEWDVLEGNEKLIGIDNNDAIIVNIGTTDIDFDDLLSNLFDKDIKIIINEAELTNKLSGVKRQSWQRHLLNKIDSSFSIIPDNLDNKAKIPKLIDFKAFGFKQVWVLAASIGGPEALSKFLSEFSGSEKIFFIIIQHMDKEFLPMMAEQFNQNSKLLINEPLSGMKITSTNCIVYPGDEDVVFKKNGIIDLQALTEVFAYTPCIDEACRKLSNNIENLNIAIFSGMSTDGVMASETIKQKGNKVITQSEESCVLSTIISGVKEKIQIDFDGTPQQMAQYIIKSL